MHLIRVDSIYSGYQYFRENYMLKRSIFKTLLATVAMLPLAGAAISDGHARTDLVIADLGLSTTAQTLVMIDCAREVGKRPQVGGPKN